MTAAVALVVLVGPALAGCGGGPDGGDGKAAQVSSFKKDASAICKATRADLEKAASKVDPKNPTKADLADVAEKIVEYLGDEVADLKKLDPPADAADDLDAFVASLSEVVDVARDKGADFIDPATKPFAAANDRATMLGLDACVL